jgi:hypothetical protein
MSRLGNNAATTTNQLREICTFFRQALQRSAGSSRPRSNDARIAALQVRFWDGPNYVVLPECRSLDLHRSDGVSCLNVLWAPKLERLSIRACYAMETVRVWDMPGVTPEEVLELNRLSVGHASRTAASCSVGSHQAVFDETNGAGDLDVISVLVDAPLASLGDVQAACAYSKCWKALRKRSKARTPAGWTPAQLPNLVVENLNMELSPESLRHLRTNPRVELMRGSMANLSEQGA